MIKYIFGIAAISLLFMLPTFVSSAQAAGEEGFVKDICVDSPNAYKEIIAVHKERGFEAAKSKFYIIMQDPDSDCYIVPGGGGVPVIVLETLQEDSLRNSINALVCVALYRVELKGQADPTKKYYAVKFTPGMCNKNSI